MSFNIAAAASSSGADASIDSPPVQANIGGASDPANPSATADFGLGSAGLAGIGFSTNSSTGQVTLGLNANGSGSGGSGSGSGSGSGGGSSGSGSGGSGSGSSGSGGSAGGSGSSAGDGTGGGPNGPAPRFALSPASQTIEAGASVTFSAAATASGSVTYQWLKDGIPVPGATATEFTIAAVKPSDSGNYQLMAVDAGGGTTSAPAALVVLGGGLIQTVPPTGGSIESLSADAQITAANGAFTLSFTLGTGGHQILIRAVGPGLAAGGVSGMLAQPELRVLSQGRILVDNSGWTSGNDPAVLNAAASQLGDFTLSPDNADAATLVTLPAGTYTVLVSGLGGATGSVLVEALSLN